MPRPPNSRLIKPQSANNSNLSKNRVNKYDDKKDVQGNMDNHDYRTLISLISYNVVAFILIPFVFLFYVLNIIGLRAPFNFSQNSLRTLIIPASYCKINKKMKKIIEQSFNQNTGPILFVLGQNSENKKDTKTRANEFSKNIANIKKYVVLGHKTLRSSFKDIVREQFDIIFNIVKDHTNKSIILYGTSIGAAIMLAVADIFMDKNKQIGNASEKWKISLILDRCFDSIGRLVTSISSNMGFLFCAWPLINLLGWNINNTAMLKKIILNENIQITVINTKGKDDVLGCAILTLRESEDDAYRHKNIRHISTKDSRHSDYLSEKTTKAALWMLSENSPV